MLLEYVDGAQVYDLIVGGRLSEDEKKKYVRYALEAIAYMQSKGIVHGDLHAGNILLSEKKDRMVIIDLGTARHGDEMAQRQEISQRRGMIVELATSYIGPYSMDKLENKKSKDPKINKMLKALLNKDKTPLARELLTILG